MPEEKNDLEIEKSFIKALAFHHEPDSPIGPHEQVIWEGNKAMRYPMSRNIGFECRHCGNVVYYKVLDFKRAATDNNNNPIMVHSRCPKRTT